MLEKCKFIDIRVLISISAKKKSQCPCWYGLRLWRRFEPETSCTQGKRFTARLSRRFFQILRDIKLRSHTMKSLQTRLFISVIVNSHTVLKRFNDIVTIAAVIVFLAVIVMLLMISLCVIATSRNVKRITLNC